MSVPSRVSLTFWTFSSISMSVALTAAMPSLSATFWANSTILGSWGFSRSTTTRRIGAIGPGNGGGAHKSLAPATGSRPASGTPLGEPSLGPPVSP